MKRRLLDVLDDLEELDVLDDLANLDDLDGLDDLAIFGNLDGLGGLDVFELGLRSSNADFTAGVFIVKDTSKSNHNQGNRIKKS